MTMMLHKYRSRQVHETLNGVNLSSIFRDICIPQNLDPLCGKFVFGPWASPYEANALVAYGSSKRMVTGTRAGSRIKTRNFKQRFLPHHKSQRRDIWCTNSPVVPCFNPKFVDRSVPYEAKQRRVKFRWCFDNIPLAECNVSVPNVRSSGTEPKAPVTDYRNRGSSNHTRG